MDRLLFFFLLASTASFAQTRLQFSPQLHGEILTIAEEEMGAAAGAKQVETLRFYLSNIRLLRGGAEVYTPTKKHHLLDVEIPASLTIPLDLPESLRYDELVFTIGVDSLTSAAGVFGGDLDPTLGMYWTWRSGYIHFKLEGSAPECPGRNHRFQFHVGGYQAPFNAIREVRLAVDSKEPISVRVDLDRFFQATDLREKYQVMSPNEEAMTLADLLTHLFYLKD
ncbi:MAG: MbnP family protein [Bacteroidota bacterium]